MENKKVISLPTNGEKIYKQILTFMNFALDLTKQEIDLVAEVVKLNNEYQALPENKRFKFIFSTEMRKESCNKIGLTDKQFNTVLSKVKKKMYLINRLPIINELNELNPGLMFKPSSEGFFIEVNLVNTQIKSIVEKPVIVESENKEVVLNPPISDFSKPEEFSQKETVKENIIPSDMIPDNLLPLPNWGQEEFNSNDIDLM